MAANGNGAVKDGRSDPLTYTNFKVPNTVTGTARDANGVYDPTRALEHIPEVTPILHLFLSGKMKEADVAIKGGDPKAETLYYSLGQTLIESFKAFMSFENEDLHDAIALAKHSATIANQHRRHASYTSKFSSLVSRALSGAGWIKGMTDVERHAELAYQESVLMRAILGIMYSGDWFAFVKEALALRSANISYRNMHEYLRQADKAAGGYDKSIDVDWRSGVLFGDGVNALVLSLLPAKIISFVTLFGFNGDRYESLSTLYKVGGWANTTVESPYPEVGADVEGVRRPIADIFLLIFHLLLSNYTYRGVDLEMASRIVNWSFKRYPEGVFYLYSEGRILELQAQPDKAIGFFNKMIDACQVEFKSLHNISLWELCICYMALVDLENGIAQWRHLLASANWSKCSYTYALACCLIGTGEPEKVQEGAKLMADVPGLMQRIAGRSIPLEKYAARKAKKFQAQNNRLLLPHLEMSYHFLCFNRAPLDILLKKTLPAIEAAVAEIDKYKASNGKGYTLNGSDGAGYWDDYCLAHFMLAVALRFVAYKNDDATPESRQTDAPIPKDAGKRAFASFQNVLDNGSKIEVDHYVVYYTHYELGLLCAAAGQKDAAHKHLDLLLSGKTLVHKTEKGKYSMESNLLMRTHAAMEHLGFETPK